MKSGIKQQENMASEHLVPHMCCDHPPQHQSPSVSSWQPLRSPGCCPHLAEVQAPRPQLRSPTGHGAPPATSHQLSTQLCHLPKRVGPPAFLQHEDGWCPLQDLVLLLAEITAGCHWKLTLLPRSAPEHFRGRPWAASPIEPVLFLHK